MKALFRLSRNSSSLIARSTYGFTSETRSFVFAISRVPFPRFRGFFTRGKLTPKQVTPLGGRRQPAWQAGWRRCRRRRLRARRRAYRRGRTQAVPEFPWGAPRGQARFPAESRRVSDLRVEPPASSRGRRRSAEPGL